jgi:hypothetical protein
MPTVSAANTHQSRPHRPAGIVYRGPRSRLFLEAEMRRLSEAYARYAMAASAARTVDAGPLRLLAWSFGLRGAPGRFAWTRRGRVFRWVCMSASALPTWPHAHISGAVYGIHMYLCISVSLAIDAKWERAKQNAIPRKVPPTGHWPLTSLGHVRIATLVDRWAMTSGCQVGEIRPIPRRFLKAHLLQHIRLTAHHTSYLPPQHT